MPFAASRMFNQMYGLPTLSKFIILDQAQVDSNTWYTVSCAREVSIWLREQPKELQRDIFHTKWGMMYPNMYDIHEKLYTILSLKWG